MKNKDIIRIYGNLKQFEKCDVALSSKVLVKIIKSKRALKSCVYVFDEAQKALLDKYNAKDENGVPEYTKTGTIHIAEEYRESYVNEFNSLSNLEESVDLTYLTEEDISCLNLSPKDISLIEDLIKF